MMVLALSLLFARGDGGENKIIKNYVKPCIVAHQCCAMCFFPHCNDLQWWCANFVSIVMLSVTRSLKFLLPNIIIASIAATTFVIQHVDGAARITAIFFSKRNENKIKITTRWRMGDGETYITVVVSDFWILSKVMLRFVLKGKRMPFG